MTLGSLILAALFVWFVWVIARNIAGRRASDGTKPSRPTKKTYELNAAPRTLIEMPDATTRLFTYEDESRAAWARQRLWIRYEDRAGNTTERKVEIYHPEDDEYIFAWCCSKLEPRTFARRSLHSWRLLPERFEFDPIVEQYWREEGTRDQSEKLPWRRWLDTQPDAVAEHYQYSEGLTLTHVLSTGLSHTNERISPQPEGPRWWEMRDEALLKYSHICSDSLADYQPVIQLMERAIAAGASVSAQARLYRVLGEIFHHCGDTLKAIQHLERAIKLDPGIGIKKLLARLKEETTTR